MRTVKSQIGKSSKRSAWWEARRAARKQTRPGLPTRPPQTQLSQPPRQTLRSVAKACKKFSARLLLRRGLLLDLALQLERARGEGVGLGLQEERVQAAI